MKLKSKKLICLCTVIAMSLVLSGFAVSATTFQTNQDATAYTWTGHNTANGKVPTINMVAVHATVKGGTVPVIPYGTILYIDSVIQRTAPYEEWDNMVYTPDGEVESFKVEDLGDQGYTHTRYWLDFYWGADVASANQFGTRTVNYHY